MLIRAVQERGGAPGERGATISIAIETAALAIQAAALAIEATALAIETVSVAIEATALAIETAALAIRTTPIAIGTARPAIPALPPIPDTSRTGTIAAAPRWESLPQGLGRRGFPIPARNCMGYRPMQRTSTRPPTLCRSPVGGAIAAGRLGPDAYNSSAGERTSPPQTLAED